MEHVGVVVEDLDAAREFFAALGLEPQGEMTIEGAWADRIVGLVGVRSDIVMMRAPDGSGQLELVKFHSPPSTDGHPGAPANATGLRHITFSVEDLDTMLADLLARGGELVGELERYEDAYRLCYLRGPEGIIIELAEELG